MADQSHSAFPSYFAALDSSIPPGRQHPPVSTAPPPAAQRGRREDASGDGVSLGTNAKYKNKARIDPETGEIFGIVDPMAGRVQRFALQAVARKFLPKSRTDKCLRLRQKGQQVEIWKSKEFRTASFAVLQTCKLCFT